jgi:hypothetical protein
VLVVETTKVDGLLLRDRITRDRQNAKAVGEKNRLGASYWRGLVQLYSAGVEGVQSLRVKDQSMPVQDALIQGLEAAVRSNPATRTAEPLVVFLQHCQPLNQKEIVGLFKALGTGNFMGRSNSDIVMVEVMKYLCKSGQVETFSKEVSTMRPLFDDALTRRPVAPAPAHACTSSRHAQICAKM